MGGKRDAQEGRQRRIRLALRFNRIREFDRRSDDHRQDLLGTAYVNLRPGLLGDDARQRVVDVEGLEARLVQDTCLYREAEVRIDQWGELLIDGLLQGGQAACFAFQRQREHDRTDVAHEDRRGRLPGCSEREKVDAPDQKDLVAHWRERDRLQRPLSATRPRPCRQNRRWRLPAPRVLSIPAHRSPTSTRGQIFLARTRQLRTVRTIHRPSAWRKFVANSRHISFSSSRFGEERDSSLVFCQSESCLVDPFRMTNRELLSLQDVKLAQKKPANVQKIVQIRPY